MPERESNYVDSLHPLAGGIRSTLLLRDCKRKRRRRRLAELKFEVGKVVRVLGVSVPIRCIIKLSLPKKKQKKERKLVSIKNNARCDGI